MNRMSLALWRAVAERDLAADGSFVYGVRSTRIFCKPSCPSRRPKPEGVDYFPTSTMAQAAGYRPCKRCVPDRPDAAANGDGGLFRACAAIAQAPESRWTSSRLARVSGTSIVALRRAFRRTLGLTPRDYVAACRHRRFQSLLKDGERVTDALYASGYSSPSGVYGVAGGEMTPATYRRGGAGVTIEWMTTASAVGRVLVAATARGVCFVAVGADDRELDAAIRAEFPAARLVRSRSGRLRRFAEVARAVTAGRPVSTSVPADVAGTAFQWRVWRALTGIPAGRPTTYTELAKSIGQPSAIRAVARACATNPLSLVIPCHRVVGSDGTLRGYRWGLTVKQTLLGIEGAGRIERRQGLGSGPER